MPHKDPAARLAYDRAWRAARKEQLRLYNRAYREANKEHLQHLHHLYYQANKEQLDAKSKERYATKKAVIIAHNALYRASHLKEKHAYDTQWRKANPDKRMASQRRRRAMKAGAPLNDLTHAQWLEIQEAQDHRCHYCGQRCKGRLTQDHILPLVKGGSHTLHNVIGACRTCNVKKNINPPPIAVQPLLLTIAPARKRKVS